MGDISLRGRGIVRVGLKKGSLPDLTGDGKVTRADVLKGRGVFKKGSYVDMSEEHEGMESKMKKADKLTSKMSKKKKGKMMKGKR